MSTKQTAPAARKRRADKWPMRRIGFGPLSTLHCGGCPHFDAYESSAVDVREILPPRPSKRKK